MAKKLVNVIERNGEKTVAKKTSFITWTKRSFTIVSMIWIVFVLWFPLHIKNTYSQPIKKSIVVSMFYDLQHNISEQYAKLLNGIKKSINLEKPINVAIDKVKLADNAVKKVTDTTAKAKEKTADIKKSTSSVSKLTGLANKFGVKTDSIDEAVNTANKTINKADNAVAKVDSTAAVVNNVLFI